MKSFRSLLSRIFWPASVSHLNILKLTGSIKTRYFLSHCATRWIPYFWSERSVWPAQSALQKAERIRDREIFNEPRFVNKTNAVHQIWSHGLSMYLFLDTISIPYSKVILCWWKVTVHMGSFKGLIITECLLGTNYHFLHLL